MDKRGLARTDRIKKEGEMRCCMSLLAFFVFSILSARAIVSAEMAEVVGRDSNFIAYSNGIVKDTKTGLEWVAGPDVDTSYYKAAEWVRNLDIAGGGWRMPKAQELKTLYRKPGNLSSVTPLLKTTGIHVWPQQDNEDLSLYLFRYMDPYGTRGFAVRHSTDD